MAKEKIDIVIDGVTYKDIQVTSGYGGRKNIDTAGIAQLVRQFVKNNYGNVKVWARSRSFAGGSSVDINLWNFPTDWFIKIEEFANKFGKYNDYGMENGGDGYWRGRNAGATTTSGEKLDNYSPYMSVSNKAPWDSKEYDMTPPDYTKTLPKKSSGRSFKEGFKKFWEKKTEGFDHIYSCGNGWKIFLKDEDPKYTYRVVKDYEVKPVGKEQFYNLKGDMLEAGFQWSVKAQCFERTTIGLKLNREFFEQIICNILNNYFPKVGEFTSEIAEELPTEKKSQDVDINQLISDIQLLVDLEVDEANKLSLLQYLNDLQTLKMLEN